MARKGSLVQIARTLPWQTLGGMETHAWQLAKAWQRRGWDVDVLTTSFEDRTHVEEREGVRVHYLQHLPLNRADVPMWRWWHRFAARVRDYAVAHRVRADVLHSESIYGHRLFHALKGSAPPPATVMTIHGTGLLTYREQGRRQLLSEVSRFHWRAVAQALFIRHRAWRERTREIPSAQRIVPVSADLERHLVDDYRLPPQRIEVIPNGVEVLGPNVDRDRIRLQLGLPGDLRLILYVGRLEASKGVQRLLEHVRRVPRDRVVVVGAGSEEARLRQLAQSLPNPGCVRFLGPLPAEEKQRLIAAADVLALPSDSEGQPIVLLEALAAGTPVYATRPWVPAGLQPLVASGTDVTAGIEDALARGPRVRAAAPQIATDYSWDRIAERYEAAFERARP